MRRAQRDRLAVAADRALELAELLERVPEVLREGERALRGGTVDAGGRRSFVRALNDKELKYRIQTWLLEGGADAVVWPNFG